MTYCFRLQYYWWFDQEPKGQWNQCLWPQAHIWSILLEIHPAEGFRANCLHLLWVNNAFSCPDELNQHYACNNCQICPASFFFTGYQSSVHCSSCSYCPAPAVKGFWLSRGDQFSWSYISFFCFVFCCIVDNFFYPHTSTVHWLMAVNDQASCSTITPIKHNQPWTLPRTNTLIYSPHWWLLVT